MKKFLATLLASAMVVATLSGCGQAKDEPKEVSSTTETAVSETAETESGDVTPAQQAILDRKAEAEKNGSYEKVIISFFDWTGAPAGIERINQKLSEYTEEKLGVDVDLLIIDSAAYSDDIKLMLSSGEQVDLFSTCGPGYMTCVNNGYTADLEEDDLLGTYAPGLKDVIRSDYFDACRVGGTLYGVPPIKDYAIQTAAICIGTEYLEGANVDLSKFTKDSLGYYKCSWDDVDEMFAKMHEAFPDKTVYTTCLHRVAV